MGVPAPHTPPGGSPAPTPQRKPSSLRPVPSSPVEEEPVGSSVEVPGWISHLHPPDVWRAPIPSLAEQWDRFRDGSHLPDSPVAKAAAVVCLGIATVAGMAAVLLHWAAASPARVGALAVAGLALGVVGSTLAEILAAVIDLS